MRRRLLGGLFLVLALHLLRVQACTARSRADEEARLAYLAQRIDSNDFPGLAPGHPFDGEWKLMTLSWAVAASANLGFSDGESRPLRAAEVSRWTARMLAADVRAADTREWGSDPLATLERAEGHAGYLGHVLLSLDAACLLDAPRDEVLHARLAEALARRMAEAPAGLIETYPGELYVPDNVVVMAGLAQYDACLGEPRHAALVSRWLATLQARWVDPDNGVLVFAPGQRARGSGAAWNSFYLPFIDARFAADQSRRTWATFADTALGGWLHGLREWPRGMDGPGDVDSGPLVMGISPSATGFALGDATLWGRQPDRDGVARLAELVGVSFGGHYLFSPLVGDAITLAARTRSEWPSKSREAVSLTRWPSRAGP
jgi:hypothetical protein